jgi:hypothetical protein
LKIARCKAPVFSNGSASGIEFLWKYRPWRPETASPVAPDTACHCVADLGGGLVGSPALYTQCFNDSLVQQ